MKSRYKQGLEAQNGACNMRALSRSLAGMVEEVLDEKGSPARDPAVQLMVHQMSWLVFGGRAPADCDPPVGHENLRQELELHRDDPGSWQLLAISARLIPAVDAVVDRAGSDAVTEDDVCKILVAALHHACLGKKSSTGWEGWDAAMDFCKAQAEGAVL